MSVAKAEVSRSCRCEAPTPSTNTKHLHQGRSRAGHPGCSSDSMCCHGHPVLPWAGHAGIMPSPWRCRNGFLPLTASVGCLRGQGWSSPGLGCHSRLREYLGDVQRAVRTALTYPVSQPRCGDDSCCQQFTSDQKLQAELEAAASSAPLSVWVRANSPALCVCLGLGSLTERKACSWWG